jgi:tetratricopeptide (TPR) repeat protein/transcriptional regulator with XRE-family HTH domain
VGTNNWAKLGKSEGSMKELDMLEDRLEEFRSKLKKYCREANINQKDLAKACGIHPSEFSKWLRGKVPIDHYNAHRVIETLANYEKFSSREKVLSRREAEELIRLMDVKKLSGNTPFQDALLKIPEVFIGRVEDKKWLRNQLLSEGIIGISALNGMGGIGKTALAGFVIHQMRKDGYFPDGIAVEICVGRKKPKDTIEIVQNILASFDPKHSRSEGIEERELRTVVHRLLDGKKTLIVLDNIEPELDIEKVVDPFREVSTTLLLTARHTLPSTIVSVRASRHLDLLSSKEALKLFAQSFGKETIGDFDADEQSLAEEVVKILDRHTLATRVAGAYAGQTKRDLRGFVEDLRKPLKALMLPDGHTSKPVMKSLALSIEDLSIEARELFTGLAAFASPSIGREAALTLSRSFHPALSNAEEPLNSLINRALVEYLADKSIPTKGDYERLRLHPLLWDLANYYFQKWEPDKRNLTYQSVARYYLEYSNNKDLPFVALTSDHDNIIGALEWAIDCDQTQIVADFCSHLYKFWRDTGRTKEGLRFLPQGTQAAELLSDRTQKREERIYEAQLLLALGQVYRRDAKLDATEQAFQRNLQICEELGDIEGEATALSYLGRVAQSRGRLEEAEKYCRKALEIHRTKGNLQEEAVDLSSLGEIFQTRGQYKEAREHFQKALSIQRRVKHNVGEGISLCFLGMNDLAQGQFDQAERQLNAAREFNQSINYRVYEGIAYRELGYLAYLQGQPEKAEKHYTEAERIADETLDRQSQVVLKARRAALYADQGEIQKAEELYQESIALGKNYQYLPRVADALQLFAQFLFEQQGREREGCAVLIEASQLYTQMAAPDLAKDVRNRMQQWECREKNSG